MKCCVIFYLREEEWLDELWLEELWLLLIDLLEDELECELDELGRELLEGLTLVLLLDELVRELLEEFTLELLLEEFGRDVDELLL